MSRPKTVMNQGIPAAGSRPSVPSARRRRAARSAIDCRESLLEGVPGCSQPRHPQPPGGERLPTCASSVPKRASIAGRSASRPSRRRPRRRPAAPSSSPGSSSTGNAPHRPCFVTAPRQENLRARSPFRLRSRTSRAPTFKRPGPARGQRSPRAAGRRARSRTPSRRGCPRSRRRMRAQSSNRTGSMPTFRTTMRSVMPSPTKRSRAIASAVLRPRSRPVAQVERRREVLDLARGQEEGAAPSIERARRERKRVSSAKKPPSMRRDRRSRRTCRTSSLRGS